MAYANMLLSVVVGIVLVPFVIRSVGAANYGLWQVLLEMVGYLGMTELGVLGVLPMLLAAADGRQDNQAARRLIVNGLGFAVTAAGLLLAATAAISANVLGWLPGVSQTSVTEGRGPLLVLMLATAVAIPLKVFTAILAGLQDFFVAGILRLAQTFLILVLTVGLLLAGAKLYALSLAAVVPALAVGVAAAIRARTIAPEFFRELPRPRFREIAGLVRDGFGSWIGGLGFGLMTASNGLLILIATKRVELVTAYVCLAKLPVMLQNLSRIPHDSGLVGLAQIYAAGGPNRTRHVTGLMIRVQAIMTGLCGAVALLVNPAFASRWYPVEYAGDAVNIAVTSTAVLLGLTCVSTGQVNAVGKWIHLGLATFMNSILYVLLAVPATRRLGLPGLAVALWLSTAVTSLAAGLYFHSRTYGTGWREWTAAVGGVVIRLGPVWVVAAYLGIALRRAPVWLLGLAVVGVGLLALGATRQLIQDIPFPSGVTRVLMRLRIISAGSVMTSNNGEPESIQKSTQFGSVDPSLTLVRR